MEAVEQARAATLKTLVREVRGAHGHDYGLLLGMPGVGPVVVCGYVTLIGTPHRFSRKNKLWRYAGLGNTRHVSDGTVYQDRPSKSGNRLLKWVVGQHFMGAVERARTPNVFRRRWERLVREGRGAKVARRQVCRSLLSTVRAIWMKGEPYREEEIAAVE
jgi:transposase